MSTTFGERLQALRSKHGMTLEKLAKDIDSSKSYVWELENKPNIRPSAETVYKLAKTLDVTVEELMGHPAKDPEDQVFFREYKGLQPETKKQLKSIMEALKKNENE